VDRATAGAGASSTAGRILDAARELFYDQGYLETSVDQIAKACGFSRATFYLHYKSKDEVLFGLLKEDLEAQIEHYRDLASIRTVSTASLGDWIREFRKTMDQRRKSFGLFWADEMINSDGMVLATSHREHAIAILGRRFPSFDLSEGPEDQREARRARCYMIIFLIECVSIGFSGTDQAPPLAVGAEVLAEIIVRFLESGQIAIGGS
jgi:AcrR family transcriptional regulator